MLDELRIGTEMEEALQRAAERIRVPDFRFFAVSLLLQRQTGGGIAETSPISAASFGNERPAFESPCFDRRSTSLRCDCGDTPFVAGVGLFLINRDLITVLFFDPRGRFMLGIAIASLLSGIVRCALS